MEVVIPTDTQKYSSRFEIETNDGQLTVEGVLHTTDVVQYDHDAGVHLPVSTQHSFTEVEIWQWSKAGDIVVWDRNRTNAWLAEHGTRLAADVEQQLLEN